MDFTYSLHNYETQDQSEDLKITEIVYIKLWVMTTSTRITVMYQPVFSYCLRLSLGFSPSQSSPASKALPQSMKLTLIPAWSSVSSPSACIAQMLNSTLPLTNVGVFCPLGLIFTLPPRKENSWKREPTSSFSLLIPLLRTGLWADIHRRTKPQLWAEAIQCSEELFMGALPIPIAQVDFPLCSHLEGRVKYSPPVSV